MGERGLCENSNERSKINELLVGRHIFTKLVEIGKNLLEKILRGVVCAKIPLRDIR